MRSATHVKAWEQPYRETFRPAQMSRLKASFLAMVEELKRLAKMLASLNQDSGSIH